MMKQIILKKCFHAFNHLVREIVHITCHCLCYDDAITLKFPEIHL